jgi:hypothetical protein
MGKVNRKHFNNNTQNKKRKYLTFSQKKELCEKHRDQKLSGVQLAREYEISDSAVSNILKKSEHWLSIDTTLLNANNFREKASNYPQIEEAMSIWVDQQISRDLTLSGPIIQEKAKEFAILFEINDFSASGGWLNNFKRRNNLHTFKISGEAGSAPINEIPQMRVELQEILQEYELRDIWNCDETALFWRLLPCKTIAHSPVLGKKRSKERVSILVTCNASGDEKLPLLFIHKYETPRILKGIEKKSLPVWYYWNSKAWMQRSIFKHFLERLNSKMNREGRHIILLMDNAKCHICDNISNLSNIKVHFLPPNTTSHIQPLDQGIIYSLKAKYRKLLCQNRIQAYDFYEEGDPTPPPIDILDSINLIADAWKRVTKKTIINSWAKAEIISNDDDSSISDNDDDSEDTEVEEDIEDFQSLIDKLQITDPLSMEEYVNIDDDVLAEEELSLEEIANMIRGQSAVEEDDVEEEEHESIITSDALNCIEKLIKYIQQNNLGINNADMQNLVNLKKKIISDSKKRQKQGRIDDFFQS